jgi:voltage-gated potassium channel
MRLETWKKYTEWPLTGLAIVFLILYSIQVISNLPESKTALINISIQIIWVAFIIDYTVQLTLAPNRKTWFWKNSYQLVIIALPMLRPLRLLRLLSLLKLLQQIAFKALQGKLVVYVISTAFFLVYMGALEVLDAEQNAPHANIKNFGDAIWWATTTITTVGYGDYYPVTLTGRLVAVGLMISGVAVVGVVTASLASWLVSQINASAIQAEKQQDQKVLDAIQAINDKIDKSI